jgi:hypothetical protein
VPAYLQIEASIAEEENDGVQFKLREYDVEACEEPCLFTGLVTLQLGILRAFLVRFREGVQGKNAYSVLLDEVDKRGLGCAKQAKITGQAASSLNIVLVEQVCRMHRNPDSQEPDCF